MYAAIGFELLPWQSKILRDIYGSVDCDTGLRRYTTAYISMAKKNGKTFLVGGLPLYHLMVEQTEFTPLVIGAASAKGQAALVFKAACSLIQPNSRLREEFRILESTKRIIHRHTGCVYQVMAADGDVNDGQGPSLVLIDELHRWKNAKHETNRDVLIKGTRARREPLTVQITTAGETHECPMWSREHSYARQIIAGSLKSDKYYAAIWEADPEKLKTDPDYWKSRAARVEANPSHEDHPGGFIKDAALVEDLEKAVAVPEEQRKYFRYTLNTEVSAEARYIPAGDWAKCAKPLRPLVDRPCYAGVDLGATSDMCALVLVFPDDDGTFDVLPFFWVPELRIDELEKKTRAPYWAWVRQEILISVPGFAVTEDDVIKKLEWAMEMFQVLEVCYDPWHAAAMAQKLIDKHGAVMVKISQNFSLLSEPTKKVAALCADEKIRHDNHPILNWHADCATVRSDGKDNVMLVKPDRNASTKRIDGTAALVNAMVRALVASEQKKPMFLTEGFSYI
jgi:phage terminase large subunit-like protein